MGTRSGMRARHFFIHRATIERSVVVVDATVVRDRKISNWVAIYKDVRCYKEHLSSETIRDDRLGGVMIDRYRIWFDQQGIGILPQDRIKIGSDYYLVEGIQRFTDEKNILVVDCRKMGYTQS